ncbi:uncharacterized protein MELLADRAFT_58272 [Melampsora larici-populina 98AG31]|uniref:Uncharacterized protein n=1 Tax=Melampsora larici-populina (strain 98AG31 / pathotype 3-4-7) TaxID=747676 RepID=F4SE64_MELLP|nr:uncharacterized protein MELLADRAFT_58272 [Melampsora larici-populina 98AG31]EGF97061.1 hypothetical protein MELLADRAFT_58272 [Melampsora larici-populina 98AG31]
MAFNSTPSRNNDHHYHCHYHHHYLNNQDQRWANLHSTFMNQINHHSQFNPLISLINNQQKHF